MAFLDELLEGGSGYKVKRTEEGASFKPADDNDDALETFQDIVQLIEQNEGDGYEIHLRHETSDHGRDFVDRLLITIE